MTQPSTSGATARGEAPGRRGGPGCLAALRRRLGLLTKMGLGRPQRAGSSAGRAQPDRGAPAAGAGAGRRAPAEGPGVKTMNGRVQLETIGTGGTNVTTPGASAPQD